MNTSAYYLEWSEEGRRNRMVSNHRILIYGDISTHEMRYAIMKSCRCKTDAISTNLPLCEHLQRISRQIEQNAYSIVIIGETSNQAPANCESLPYLMQRHPATLFVSATAPGLWMHSSRYRHDEPQRKANNQKCRETASTQGWLLMDIEAWMIRNKLTDVQSASDIKVRLALSYLRQWRISKAWKCLNEKTTEKSLARYSNIFLAQMAGQYIRKISKGKFPTSETLWRNSWQRQQANGLLIGDSNIRALSRANHYLSFESDMYATSYPMLSEENEEIISRHLLPGITHIIFSFGAHHLTAQSGPEFEPRLRSIFTRLKSNGRQVLAMTSTPWACKSDFSQPDTKANKLIESLNGRMLAVAKDCGVNVLDLAKILSRAPHSDYVHFSQESYTAPADMLEQWIKGAELNEYIIPAGSNESC